MKTTLRVLTSVVFVISCISFISVAYGNAGDTPKETLNKTQKLTSFQQHMQVAAELADCDSEQVLRDVVESSGKAASRMMMDVTECQTISSCDGDAEQLTDGSNLVICDTGATGDLDLGQIGDDLNELGLVWSGWNIPAGATITSADLQFTALENSIRGAAYTITGEASDDAAVFSAGSDVNSRPLTSASVNWSPGTWIAEDSGTAQLTPDLTAIIQEIVNRPGYVQGNNIGLHLEGKGIRIAYPYDFDPNKAPELCITYEVEEEVLPMCDGCPDVQLVSLDGVPNFPIVDLLNLCSVPDTIPFLIYNQGECKIEDVKIRIAFDSGLSYGGFVQIDPQSTATGVISEFDLSDLTNPIFIIDEILPGESYIADFGVQADCDVDIETEQDINFDAFLEFSYDDVNGTTPTCTDEITEVGAYNGGIRIPVVNVLSVSPANLNISQAGTPSMSKNTDLSRWYSGIFG